MRIFLACSIVFLVVTFPVLGRVWPSDSAVLNYRIIGFSFPDSLKAKNYKLEIAGGYCTNENTFTKHIIKVVSGNTNQLVAEVPRFDSAYTWRVVYMRGPRTLATGTMHFFKTGTSSFLDTAKMRIRVTKPAETYQDAYVFIDATRALYDMKGQAVWYLPALNGVVRENASVRDLKLSPKGTITFLMDGDAYEISYDGEVLWMGANGRKTKSDTLEGYHHELTRLSNGHYMVLGFEPIARKRLPMARDSFMRRGANDSVMKAMMHRQRKPRFGNVLEYDEKGQEVWSWQAAPYFDGQDMTEYKKINGAPEYDVHENSFYFDQKNGFVYVGFRNISQILKISYPSGEVVKAYGKIEHTGDEPGAGMFCGQHSCMRSDDGLLYVFDNGCSLAQQPKVVVMKEPATPKDTLRKIWEFACPVDLMSVSMPARRVLLTSGGNVIALPDHSFFVSTCSPYNKVFIVNRNKEVLWDASAEKWHASRKEWEALPTYRASIITSPKMLENLIWQGH